MILAAEFPTINIFLPIPSLHPLYTLPTLSPYLLHTSPHTPHALPTLTPLHTPFSHPSPHICNQLQWRTQKSLEQNFQSVSIYDEQFLGGRSLLYEMFSRTKCVINWIIELGRLDCNTIYYIAFHVNWLQGKYVSHCFDCMLFKYYAIFSMHLLNSMPSEAMD